MKPLTIDFLPARLPVWAVVACAVLIAVVLGETAWIRAGQDDLRVRRSQLDAARSARAALRETNDDHGDTAKTPYEADTRRALKEASFSTAQALTVIERVVVAGVTPTSIELQADIGLARLELEFTDQGTVLKYLEALNAGETPVRWRLLRVANKPAPQAGGVAVIESNW